MTDCDACGRAQQNPLTGRFNADCMPCEARALARSPAAHAREADPALIQEAMRKAWPEEAKYRQGRALVWEWLQKFDGGDEPCRLN